MKLSELMKQYVMLGKPFSVAQQTTIPVVLFVPQEYAMLSPIYSDSVVSKRDDEAWRGWRNETNISYFHRIAGVSAIH
jgi:hypothetical protein